MDGWIYIKEQCPCEACAWDEKFAHMNKQIYFCHNISRKTVVLYGHKT
jgi:hypothetical protein